MPMAAIRMIAAAPAYIDFLCLAQDDIVNGDYIF
jgi:hypothetical protein